MASGRRHHDRLADAIRRLIEHAVVAEMPDEEVAEIVETLEEIDARLKRYPRGPSRPATLPDLDHLQAAFRGDPLIGEHNPIAPPVIVERDDTTIRGKANLGAAYEGPPGYVHGAVIAGIFDMLLGLANIAAGNPGMTGTLTVKYRKPTPLRTDLTFEAKTVRVDGRKVIAKGTLLAGDELTAEAEGLFVALRMDKVVEFLKKRGLA